MVEKFYNKPLRIVKIKGKLYYHLQIEAFDHLGIFTFSIRHRRLGYYFHEDSKNVVFKYYYDPQERKSLFKIGALPFLLIAVAVHISALLALWVGVSEGVSDEEDQNKRKQDVKFESEKREAVKGGGEAAGKGTEEKKEEDAEEEDEGRNLRKRHQKRENKKGNKKGKRKKRKN